MMNNKSTHERNGKASMRLLASDFIERCCAVKIYNINTALSWKESCDLVRHDDYLRQPGVYGFYKDDLPLDIGSSMKSGFQRLTTHTKEIDGQHVNDGKAANFYPRYKNTTLLFVFMPVDKFLVRGVESTLQERLCPLRQREPRGHRYDG